MLKILHTILLILCLLGFSQLGAQDWEPVCEQGICIQSFENPGSGSINDVPNVTADDLRLRTRGNTGSNTDYAAWSDNTTTSFLLLSHTGLSNAYEYRIRVFAKTKHSEKTMNFGLTTAADLDNYYSISESHPVAQVGSLSATGTEIISTVFNFVDFFETATGDPGLAEIGQGGDFYIAILPRGTSSGTLVMIDDYVLERRALPMPPPIVNFAADGGTVEEGSSTSICLTISEPSANFPTVVEVEITSGSLSNGNSSEVETLTFPAGSSQNVCFDFSPPVTGEASTYQFVIANVSGEAEPEIGEDDRIELGVTVDNTSDECAWAGADVSICRGDDGETIGFDPNLEENSACWEDYCVKWEPEQGLDDAYTLNPVASPLETTIYTVHVTDNDGNYYGSDDVSVAVIANSQPTISPQTPYICGNGTVNLSASIAGGFDDYILMWTPNGASTPLITVDEPGAYTVLARNTETGCEAEASVNVEESNLFVEILSASMQICE